MEEAQDHSPSIILEAVAETFRKLFSKWFKVNVIHGNFMPILKDEYYLLDCRILKKRLFELYIDSDGVMVRANLDDPEGYGGGWSLSEETLCVPLSDPKFFEKVTLACLSTARGIDKRIRDYWESHTEDDGLGWHGDWGYSGSIVRENEI